VARSGTIMVTPPPRSAFPRLSHQRPWRRSHEPQKPTLSPRSRSASAPTSPRERPGASLPGRRGRRKTGASATSAGRANGGRATRPPPQHPAKRGSTSAPRRGVRPLTALSAALPVRRSFPPRNRLRDGQTGQRARDHAAGRGAGSARRSP